MQAGVQQRGLEVIGASLRKQELGKPVISTTQVSVWAALRILGEEQGIPGYGRLLREIGARDRAKQTA